MKRLTPSAISLGLFLLATALIPAASGSTIFTLTQDGCSGNCGPQSGGFGTVTLTQVDTNTVDVKLDLSNGNLFVSTGNHDALTFNIGGSTVTLFGFSSNFSQDLPPVANNSPYGPFSYGVSCTGCGNGGSAPVPSPLEFDASRASGLSVTDFVANSNGIYFASDIISGTTGKTGAVGALGETARSTVPEPATWGSVGLMLVATGVVRKRIRKGN
jgi:hypothetical protein